MAAQTDKMDTEEKAEDGEETPKEEERTFPDMEMSQKAFLLDHAEFSANAKEEVMAAVEANSMAPYYEHLCAKHEWMVDDDLMGKMKAANATELEKLEEALKDAEENHGEMEVLDALFAIAVFHARIGAKTEAYEAFEVIIVKPKVRNYSFADHQMPSTFSFLRSPNLNL